MNKETFTARYFSLFVVMNKDEALGCGYAPYKKFNKAHKEQLGIIEKIYGKIRNEDILYSWRTPSF